MFTFINPLNFMDLIANLLIVNDYITYVVVNNEVLKNIYNLFGVHWMWTLDISISSYYGTACILGQHYSYKLWSLEPHKINYRSTKRLYYIRV